MRNLQSLWAEGTSVEILKSVHRGFMINQVSRSLEAFVAEAALKALRHFMNIFDVLLQCIQIGGLFATIPTRVVQLLCFVVLHVPIEGFEISQVVPAYATSNAVFGSSVMRLHVLLDSIFCSESLGANLADLNVISRVCVVLKLKRLFES